MSFLPETPVFLLQENRLVKNLQLIAHVQESAGCTVLLALKGFAMWSVFPLLRQYVSGCAASSLNEARLASEEFGGHVHVYAPAYAETEFASLCEMGNRLSFNSLGQWQRFSAQARRAGVSCGLRVNPQIDEVEVALYNPCGDSSRLGILSDELQVLPEGVEGLHVHALCESDAEATVRLLDAIEQRFGHLLAGLKWLNLGGGHLMTRRDYDVDLLIRSLQAFSERYSWLELVLEPGSAFAWDSGVLVSSVLDIIHRGGIDIAILDISATAHMPDVLEMPYRPEVTGAARPGEKAHVYQLAGMSCLAGDVIGDYAFDQPLQIGDQVIFQDMMHYTMVKTTFFNGVQHPAIVIERENGEFENVRQFAYEDFKARLS